jgi:hypothetical protein
MVIFSNIRVIRATPAAEKMTENHGVQPLILDFSQVSRVLSVEALYENSDAQFRLNIGSNSVDLADVKSFWWRRPHAIAVDPAIRDPRHVKFAMTEWGTLLRGIFHSTASTWVNDITKDQTASHKAYQLTVAKRLQIAVPNTLMTNNPQ